MDDEHDDENEDFNDDYGDDSICPYGKMYDEEPFKTTSLPFVYGTDGQ